MKKFLVSLLAALLGVSAASAQLVNCNCVAMLPMLFTNSCQGVIPDLCTASLSCSFLPTPLLCSQSPAPGGIVGPGTHPINVIFTNPSGGQSQTCSVSFVVTPMPGVVCCATPPAGMVAWWPLDETTGAVFADLSGTGNAALAEIGAVGSAGGPTPVAGKVAGANFFVALARGRVPNANAPSLNFGQGSFSVDGWVNPVPFGAGDSPIVNKLDRPTATTAFGYEVLIVNNKVVLRLGDGTLSTHTSVNSVTPNAWNFIAVSVDRGGANTVAFHVNGVNEPAQTLTVSGSINSTKDVLIGGSHSVANPGELAVDELELFNRAITTADMNALWNAGSAGKCKTNHPCVVTIACRDYRTNTCASSVVVNYPLPSASSTCPPVVSVVCVPPSGSAFPVGTTAVICTATDSQGGSASCAFNVVVVAGLPGAYDFLAVTIPGANGLFTSPNGNGTITATTAGGPFLGLNNTMYPSTFPNLFPSSGVVQGYLAQANDNANYTVTFELQNYALSPGTVFGIWNITEECDLYRLQLFDSVPNLISPPFTWNFLGFDDDALSGNISGHHMVLDPATGLFCPTNYTAGTDCDAAFWDQLPANTRKIVLTGNLGPADGVVFYFAEPHPCCEINCPTNLTVNGCAGTLVTYPTPAPGPLCGSNVTVTCTPPSGSPFPAGTTTVTCTATRGPEILALCNFTVTVIVPPPPVITCPTNITAKRYLLCDSNCVRVAYASPQVTGGTFVSCSPPSGSCFPDGVNTVTCHATNVCGATNRCSFTVTVMFGGTEPPCANPPANMVMWLRFDEASGTTALNASAGNHGVLANAPTRTLNQYVVNSLCFDGANDYVQVTPYPAMQFGTGDFSVDAWVKPATLDSTIRVIVDHREESSLVRGYSLFLGGNNTLAFQIADGAGFINYPSTLAVPADGQWHLVAVTVKRNDSQGIRFYVDGVQDSVPRNPTGHAGSVTAGPCYPFRVGSRSSSVSGLFNGCIDEVELFRRALRADEIQAIYNARCKGKCRIVCHPLHFELVCDKPLQTTAIIYNPSSVPVTFNYSFIGLPPGPGCNLPGPTTFVPASGTVTVGALQSAQISVTIVLPPMMNGDCTCVRFVATSLDGSIRIQCDGRLCLSGHGSFCAVPSVPLLTLTNLDPAAVSFALTGNGPSSTVLNNAAIVLRSPEGQALSVTPLPGFTVPPAGGGTVTIPHTVAMPNYDPVGRHTLVLAADADGDGQAEVLATLPVVNVLPTNEEPFALTIRSGPGGGVIITWPDPCAIVEVNSNLANPAGWVPGPVQTSPWTLIVTPGTVGGFIRLRK